ncbi:SusE domain-containing protein [Psychroflexus sp. CAK57W]|uniref:SusE domain-containing protein n=1 Tax=Psychroflexus curvus TaxID=2873595 RepID=UPI001CCA6F6C|nr:SusE domain-containing protein [Psychroflexus curvus]MBZ9786462.1 SusE domain-containing protein [Psychroflexus curvus]
MKAINKLSYLKLFSFVIALSLFSCDDEELVQINENASTSLTLSTESVVMSEENAGEDILSLTWTEPNFGFQSATDYSLEVDLVGNDFSNAKVVAVGRDTSKVFTSEELNSILLNLGATPMEINQVEMRLLVSLSDAQRSYTESVNIDATPFSSILDLSTNLGIVGSATPGGWGSEDILDVPFYSTSENNVVVAYATLRDGEMKFRENNDWAVNYGDDGNDGTLEQDGANIPVTAGTYKVTVNTETLEWSLQEYSWGIVGGATVYGWDTPDVKFEYNPYQDNWKAAATFTDGEIKFRQNEEWNVEYGDTGSDGTLEQGGDNIAVEAGHYIITLDLNNLTYELEQTGLWGLVGDATTFGWDAPDPDKFLPDFGINEGMFYLNGVELSAGELKVRQNEEWGVNYGDDGNDGTLELNGANIPSTPGIYNVEMNFAVNPPTIDFYAWQ